MNRTNIILTLLLLYSCDVENKKPVQRELIEKAPIAASIHKKKKQTVAGKNRIEVIVGALQYKLENTDSKVKYLHTLHKPININKEIKSGNSKDAEYFTTYLGSIKLKEKETHVFKQYYTIQAAIEKHGHSVLIFLNKSGANYYDMELPDNLPIHMTNETFSYLISNDTIQLKIEHISEKDLILRNITSSK